MSKILGGIEQESVVSADLADMAVNAVKPRLRLSRISRGRLVRILFGLAFLIIGLTVITPHLFNTISTDAVINARVIPLVAPIAGTVQSEPPGTGAHVQAGAELVSIADRRVDRTELERLRMELAGLAPQGHPDPFSSGRTTGTRAASNAAAVLPPVSLVGAATGAFPDADDPFDTLRRAFAFGPTGTAHQ